MKNCCFLVLTCCVATLFTGCPGEAKRPENMPDLCPVTLKIIQDGSPLVGATVTLIAQDPANVVWPAGGATNETGELVVKTMSQYNGVVVGKFKVVVSKTETEGGSDATAETSDAADAGVSTNTAKTYNLVESQYRSAQTTPFEIDVTSAGVNETLDVGKAVRELIPVAKD